VPIVYLKPTTAINTSAIDTGVLTDVDEGVNGGTPDGNLQVSIANNWATGPEWRLESLPAGVGKINSATLRIRAAASGGWSDDSLVWAWATYVVGGSGLGAGTVTWDFETDDGAGLANRTVDVTGTVIASDLVVGKDVRIFADTTFNQSMGPDSGVLSWDGFELEVDYELGITAETGTCGIFSSSNDPTELYQFGDFIRGDSILQLLSASFPINLSTGQGPSILPKAGHLLIAASASIESVTTPPSGFTALNNSLTGSSEWNLWYKISDGTEDEITVDYATAGPIGITFTEYAWDGSTPTITENENETNISTAVSSQASGAATPTGSKSIALAFHGCTDVTLNFTGQAVDGSWVEDLSFFSTSFAIPSFKVSSLVNATGSQEATHTDTDTGSAMYGAIAIFDVGSSNPVLDATTPGAFTIDGVAANTEFHHSIPALAGSTALAGIDANLEFHDRFSSEAGTFSISGIDANLEYHYLIDALVGTYIVTGIDATLTVGGGNITLTADLGSYTIAGIAVNLLQKYAVIAETGSVVITGADANLEFHHLLPALTGSTALTGIDVNLEQGYALIAETGSVALTGVDANFLQGYAVIAETGSAVFNRSFSWKCCNHRNRCHSY